MIISLIVTAFLVVLLGGGYVAHLYRTDNMHKITRKPKAEIGPEFSSAAREVRAVFRQVPEANRPSLDIDRALLALDKKHGAERVEAHFVSTSRYTYTRWFSWNCSCIYDSYDEEYVGEECQYFPEYRKMYDSINEVKDALKAQEDAIAEREHQMMLAGMESDLRAVDEITAAFKTEREIIDATTKEIV